MGEAPRANPPFTLYLLRLVALAIAVATGLGVVQFVWLAVARTASLPLAWLAWGGWVVALLYHLGVLAWLMLRSSGWIVAGALGAREVQESKVRQIVAQCFSEQVRPIWNRGAAIALLLNDRLLLSRALAECLDPSELRAVLLHEAAHRKLGHLRERSAWVLLGVSVFFVPWPGMLQASFGIQGGFLFLPTLGFYLAVAAALRGLIRLQEFEADAWAAQQMGQGVSLGQALKKVTARNGHDPRRQSVLRFLSPTAGHPTCEERVKRLELGDWASGQARFRLSVGAVTFAGSCALALISPWVVQQGLGPHLAVRAARLGQVEVLARLAGEGVDLGARDYLESGMTPREVAEKAEQKAVLGWLSEKDNRMPASVPSEDRR